MTIDTMPKETFEELFQREETSSSIENHFEYERNSSIMFLFLTSKILLFSFLSLIVSQNFILIFPVNMRLKIF